jgi:hypothetical protein
VSRPACAAALAAVVLVGCTIGGGTPEPTADGFLEPQGDEATGPLVEVGSGDAFDTPWRYGIYPTEAGWCTQIEVTGTVTSHCEDVLPVADAAFGAIGQEPSEAAGTEAVDGVVIGEIVTVWLVFETGARLPATMMSLEEAGLEEKAFVGVVPPDETVTHLQALALSGEILETVDLRP